MPPSVVTSGSNGGGVISGTPQKTDNTGRDWGQGLAIGGAAAGTILGSILSFGTAAPALVAGDVALGAATIGADIAKDVAENNADAQNQQRSLQARIDAAKPVMASSPNVNTPSFGQPQMPNASPSFGQPQTPSFTPPAEKLTPAQGMPSTFSSPSMATSDRNSKTAIKDGSKAVNDFLELVRARGAWPKHIKDPHG